MSAMNAETLILIAPCSLLLGAALQIAAARLLKRTGKGDSGFSHLSAAVASVAALVGWVKAGRRVV